MSLLHAIVGRLPKRFVRGVSRLQWKHPLLKRAYDFASDRFRNADSVIQSGEGKGLRFNAGRTHAGYIVGTTERDAQLALRTLITPGMVVYDAGANVGFLSLIAARLTGPGGKVVCFEPLPENVSLLRHNVELNGMTHVTVRAEALGDYDGTAQFLVSQTPTWGRLAGTGEPAKQVGQIEVPLRTLDSLVFGDKLPPPGLIKIDVEGAEAGVLAGASRVLREISPILLIELHATQSEVARSLADVHYNAHVLGSDVKIEQANWDAKVLAVPRGRDDLCEAVRRLTAADVAP